MNKGMSENNYLSLDFKFESRKEKNEFNEKEFSEKLKELFSEFNLKKPNPEENLIIQRKKLDELEKQNVKCLFQGLGLELLAILNEGDLTLNLKLDNLGQQGFFGETGLNVEIIEKEGKDNSKNKKMIENMLHDYDQVSNLNELLEDYSYRVPRYITHEEGVKVDSKDVTVKKFKLSETNRFISNESKEIFYTEFFEEMLKLYEKDSEVIFDSGYFYDNEFANHYDNQYPDMIYNVEKKNVEDKNGYEKNFASLIIRVERGFKSVTFFHLNDVDFTNEIKGAKEFFDDKFKKILLKYNFI